MKLTRRHVLLASAAGGVAAAGGGYCYSKRLVLRVPHGWVGYTEVPVLELYPSEVGVLGDADKDVLWDLLKALGKLWGMDPGVKASFIRIVDLKTKIAPSYLKEYENAVKLFGAAKKEARSPEEAARKLLLGKNGDDASQHARVHVAQELVVRLLVTGGFAKFGLGKWRGWSGGPRGFRLSQHRAAAPRSR